MSNKRIKNKRKQKAWSFVLSFLFLCKLAALCLFLLSTYQQVLHSFAFSYFLPSTLSPCFFLSLFPPPPSYLCLCLISQRKSFLSSSQPYVHPLPLSLPAKSATYGTHFPPTFSYFFSSAPPSVSAPALFFSSFFRGS